MNFVTPPAPIKALPKRNRRYQIKTVNSKIGHICSRRYIPTTVNSTQTDSSGGTFQNGTPATSSWGCRRLPSMKGAPPPVTPCAAQVPFRLCLRQSHGTASVRWCGLRFALPNAPLLDRQAPGNRRGVASRRLP